MATSAAKVKAELDALHEQRWSEEKHWQALVDAHDGNIDAASEALRAEQAALKDKPVSQGA